jgi:glycosyltransferase involved in cell wall biosynthesis
MDGVNPSSCAILLREWLSHFDRDRFSLSICSLRQPESAGRILEENGAKVHYLGLGRFSPKNIAGITDLIDREKADIVHLHGYSSANFGRLAARKKGISNVVHEHAVLRVLPHQFLADYLLRNHTDAAVAVSESVKDFMIRGRSIPVSRITVINNGIRTDRFRKRDKETIDRKRAELNIPEDFSVVGTITRLRKEKGNEYFIRAVPYILSKFPKIIFVIVGDGPLRIKLEELTRNLNLSESVRFLGFRTDIIEMLSVFHVNVIPSLSEGFPLSLVEAMSMGNAIVATDVGGIREIAVHEKTALLVQPKNHIELGKKVSFLLKNPDIADKLSSRAKEASKPFSLEKNVSLLNELYYSLRRH